MTDWIDYCPSCGMPFEPESWRRYRREPITSQPGQELPVFEAIEVRCTYGHSFDAEAHEFRQGQGVRVKLL